MWFAGIFFQFIACLVAFDSVSDRAKVFNIDEVLFTIFIIKLAFGVISNNSSKPRFPLKVLYFLVLYLVLEFIWSWSLYEVWDFGQGLLLLWSIVTIPFVAKTLFSIAPFFVIVKYQMITCFWVYACITYSIPMIFSFSVTTAFWIIIAL